MRHKKAICFIIGAIVLLAITSCAVSPGEGEVYDIISTREKLSEIAQERDDSIDVLFAGDSLVFRAISPLKIWDITGITSYDLSDGAMRLCDQTVMVKNACKKQSPKLLVLEADIMTMAASPYKDEFALPTNLIERLFPIFHYHIFYKAWHPFDKEDGVSAIRKGYKPSEDIKPYNGEWDYMETDAESMVIEPLNQKYLDEIAGFCRENGIELLVLALPSATNYNKETHKGIQAWADAHGVPFLDMNLMWEDIGLDWNTDTKDGGDHMNSAGADKVSSFLADYLEKNYKLTDHRGDEAYADWDRDYKGAGLHR